MSLFKSEVGQPCRACGHPTTLADPPAYLKDGNVRVHRSHITDPTSGLFNEPIKRFRR